MRETRRGKDGISRCYVFQDDCFRGSGSNDIDQDSGRHWSHLLTLRITRVSSQHIRGLGRKHGLGAAPGVKVRLGDSVHEIALSIVS